METNTVINNNDLDIWQKKKPKKTSHHFDLIQAVLKELLVKETWRPNRNLGERSLLQYAWRRCKKHQLFKMSLFREDFYVYEGRGHSHSSKKHSDFTPARNKLMQESNTSLMNIFQMLHVFCFLWTCCYDMYYVLMSCNWVSSTINDASELRWQHIYPDATSPAVNLVLKKTTTNTWCNKSNYTPESRKKDSACIAQLHAECTF